MKICITSQGATLDSKIDAKFGRCAYFLIVNTETDCVEAIENTFASASGGAGIQAGQLMVSKGVKVLATGSVGPNALQVLTPAGVEIITNISGTANEVLSNYKKGVLKV